MLSIVSIKNIFKKEFFFIFFLYLTLLLSFILGENSTGGAKIDFPVATKITTDTFFLGTSPIITDEQIDYIQDTLRSFIKGLKT